MPGSKTEASVLCTSCPGTNSSGQLNDGLPTFPFGSPIVDHVGRYVDSQLTANFQHIGLRTARARTIGTYPKVNGQAPPRVYIQIGNALGAYALDTFFSQKLPAGPVTVGGVNTGMKVGGFGRNPLEKIAMWDGFFYPEATASQWYTPLIDQQDPMAHGGPFDVDDRGYLYASWPTFGWGIVKDDGRTNATHFAKVAQMVSGSTAGINLVTYPNTLSDPSGVSAQSILTVTNGGKYYAIIAGGSKDLAVFEVTNPAAPRFVAKQTGATKAMIKYDRSDAFQRVAFVDGSRNLQVYSYDGLVNGGSAITTENKTGKGFMDVAIDESGNIWAIEAERVVKLAPSGNGYVPTPYDPFSGNFGNMTALAVGAGHIAVLGTDSSGRGPAFDLRLAKLEAGGPRELDLGGFFKNYYHGGLAGYAQPGQYTYPADAQLVKWAGKTYLMYSAEGLGDVYEIQGGDSINAVMKSSFGTVNPNTPSGNPGPFPGDIVTFVATSSNPQVSYDVSWDFGNTEAGNANNDLKKTGVDVKHQFTGLTTAAKVTQPRNVRAVTIQDGTISTQVLVTLKLPTSRILVSNQTTAISAPPTGGLEVVAGTTFKDASDGSIESHYGIWTIDGVPTKLKPNESIPVGAVGTHTLKFETFYGVYDPTTFLAATAPYAAPAITLTYTVKPFRVRLNPPSNPNATTVRFSATPEFTTDTSIITAPQWNVSWTLTGGAAAGGVSTNAVAGLTGSYAVGVIPHYEVAKADILSGSTVSLQISVDPSGLSLPAQPYAVAQASSLLTTPDPLIEKTGCANSGSPCSFLAKSVGGGSTSDWTILWTLKNGSGATLATSAANPYSPSLASGSYSVTLKATKTVFDKEVSTTVTVAQSLCSPPPSDQIDVTINKIGCSTSCAPGTSIEFAPSYRSYVKQACDSFSWNFGDGTTATGEVVTHSYSASGAKTVTFTITNAAGTFTKQSTVTITGGGTTNPPPPPICSAPTGITITYSGCTAPTSCRTTDDIQFRALRGTSSLATCDTVAWTFGDNTNTGVTSPTHRYSTTGTYLVTAVVSNSNGTAPAATREITIVVPPASGGNCAIAPGPGNFSVTFTGGSSGCTFSNGTNCQVGESIEFISNNFFYTPASCDNFSWDFGDNQSSTQRNPTHTYAGNGVFNVKLTVTNNQGNFQYTRTVTVGGGQTHTEPAPVITATSFPTAGQKGKAVTFTASSNMPTTTGWTWSFGDSTPNDTSQAGVTSQTSTITHTFNSNGNFTVKVTARNSNDTIPGAPVGTAQSQITISNAPLIPEFRYLLPVVAHARGDNNSSWRTDVQIYNPDPAVSIEKPLIMEASFKGKTQTLEMTKATSSYEDFLTRMVDHDDQGPVIITTKSATTPPQIWTRTYNQAQDGATFGQFIPAIRLDTAGTGGAADTGAYFLSGLRHDNRYRTNIGFVNPNAAAVTATITVYDERRLRLGEYTQLLQPFDLVQYALKAKENEGNFKLPADAPFSVRITVPPGQWLVSYASYIDGISNDPVFLQAVRESDVASADHKVSIVPGVGHVGQWRSDVTIFNPDAEAVQFNLQYFDAAGVKKGEALGIVLDSGKFLQYGDLLKQGVFGSSVPDGVGTMKIVVTSTHDKYPMTFARTYFDDVANGTYGQGIGAFAAARANVKVNKPALIAGVRNTAHYKTNIGLLNVSAVPVTATVALLDPITGVAGGPIEYVLEPNQSLVGNFGGFGNIESGTLKITATGDVWAFASIIDKHSQDPEYVAATPAQ
jgi:PKD repeat protein